MHIYFCRCSDAELVEVIVVSTHKKKINSVHRFMTALKQQHQCWLRTHTHTHNRLMALCPGLPGWASTRKVKPIWMLLKQETVSGSGISWDICKSAPRSRQITMPVPHCSVFFTGQMPFLPPNQQCQALKAHDCKHTRQKIRNGTSTN